MSSPQWTPTGKAIDETVNPAATPSLADPSTWTAENAQAATKSAFTKQVPGFESFSKGWNLGKDIAAGDMSKVPSDITGIASDVTGMATEVAGAVADPLNWLISKGLGFLMDFLWPLKQALKVVTGDDEAVTKSAEDFDKLGQELKDKAQALEQLLNEHLKDWKGDAATAAGQGFAQTYIALIQTAQASGDIAALLKISAMLMKVAYEIILGIISDVVEWMIITWIAAQAAAVPTLGASEAAAATATTAEVGIGTARAGSETARVATKLEKITSKLSKTMDDMGGVGKLREMGGDVSRNALARNHIKNNIGNEIADSAKSNALKQAGLSKDDPNGALETADQIAKAADKGANVGTDLGTALSYAADPGAVSDYKDKHKIADPPSAPQGPGVAQPGPGGGGFGPVPPGPRGGFGPVPPRPGGGDFGPVPMPEPVPEPVPPVPMPEPIPNPVPPVPMPNPVPGPDSGPIPPFPEPAPGPWPDPSPIPEPAPWPEQTERGYDT